MKLVKTILGIIIAWLCSMQPALAMLKCKQQINVMPTVPLFRVGSLDNKKTDDQQVIVHIPPLSSSEFELNSMVLQQAHSDERLHEQSADQSVAITIEKRPVFSDLPNELLVMILHYLNPLSREAETFLRIIPLTTELAKYYIGVLECTIEQVLTRSAQEQKRLARLLCCFMRVLPTITQTMSEQVQKQVSRLRCNAYTLTDALYKRVRWYVGSEEKKCDYPCMEDLIRCCTAPCKKPKVTSHCFRRVSRATPAHAACLLYAAKLHMKGKNLARTLPQCMKELLPSTLTKVIDMQTAGEECCVFSCSTVCSFCLALIIAIILLVVMHIMYRFLFFDDNRCSTSTLGGCYYGDWVGKTCYAAAEPCRYSACCVLGTCKVRDSGFGLYCKANQKNL